MEYLLSTQAFLDRLSGDLNLPTVAWLEEQPIAEGRVALSVISLGVASALIERMSAGPIRSAMKDALHNTRRDFGDNIIPVDQTHITVWADLLNHRTPWKRFTKRGDTATSNMSDVEKLVIATALAEPFTLVERAQPYHEDASASVGLSVETLDE